MSVALLLRPKAKEVQLSQPSSTSLLLISPGTLSSVWKQHCCFAEFNSVFPLFCLQVKSGWAGYYDYNYIDQNLIIGNHPHHNNFFFANGLSGHGLQHSVAVGRAVMELIVDGGFKTIDLSRFSCERFLSEDFLEEEKIV